MSRALADAGAPRRADRGQLALLGLVLALTALAYGPSLAHGFVGWDDPQLVTENRTVRAFDWEGIATDFAQSAWHPLTLLTYAVEHALFGLDPFVFHATNLLLHLAATALAFALARRLAPGTWLAGPVVAGLFALHPLRVESVAWVSERKDVLCGALALAALLAWVAHVDGGRSRRTYAAALSLHAAALLSKPMAVTLPVAMLGVVVLRERRWRARSLLPLVPFLALSLVVGWVNLRAQQTAAILEHEPTSALQAARSAYLSLVFYVTKTVLPTGLSVHYDRQLFAPGAPAQAPFWVLAVAAGLYARRAGGRRGPFLYGLFFFLLTIAPVLKLVPFGEGSPVNDRFTYLPSVGLFLALAVPLDELRARLPAASRRLAASLPVLVLVACAAGTWHRARVWESDETLWRDVLDGNPGSATAHENLAMHYDAVGRLDLAARHMEEAVRLEPTSANLLLNLGVVRGRLGREAEAREAFERVLEVDPDSVTAHANLGASLLFAGERAAGEAHLRRALELEPGFPTALWLLGRLARQDGRPDEARALLRRAADSAPWMPQPWDELARLHLASGDADGAVAVLRAARAAGATIAPDLQRLLE